ncbi:MAG TPA: YeeE/YedE thiosulfate transporter family protein [bacterium]|nr:YeeE/YedE thiosulfate transporter family protein [bacterium]
MEWLYHTPWSPYVAGAGIGILAAVAFLISNKPFACSTSFARTAGMIEALFHREKTLARPYFQKFRPEIDWQWMLVAGLFIGGTLSAVLSGDFQWRFVHDWWGATVGPGVFMRLIGGFFGGVVLGFGARWAGGCTSGHGISGLIQLSVASLAAVVCFFAAGIATAFLMVHLF